MFGERDIVLCLFTGNLNFFVQLDTWFTYLIWNVFSVVYSVFFIVLWHCNTLCYCFSSVYCTVHCSCIVLCLLVMYVLLPKLRFFRAFSSVVRQMPGYNSALPKLINFLIVMNVPFSVFCVLFACKCVLFYCHRLSTQLQISLSLSLYIYIYNLLPSVNSACTVYLQRVLHCVANTCDSVKSSQTKTDFKHILTSFQPCIHNFDIITVQVVINPTILYGYGFM
jgi:hypothetical protein